MLATRNALNWLGVTLGLLEQQAQQNRFHPWQFDIGEMDIPPKNLKAYPTPRDPSTIVTNVIHITAVNGGFGVSRKSVDIWDAAISAGILQKRFPNLYGQLQVAGALDDHNLLVKRIATWERFRSTPYHQIGLQSGDVIANRDLSQKSWHGSAGNYGIGTAMDMGPKDKLTDFLIATFQGALKMSVQRLRMHGNPRRIITLEPHRAFDKDRRLDPGPEPWAEVVIPVVEADPYLTVDYELCLAGGLPVPRSWDKRALFNDKGKRIA
jgi:hypothetical protein